MFWSRAEPLPKPFVFIASMPRSGSTMLASMLSKPPHCLILQEPRFQKGRYRFPEQMEAVPGIDPERLRKYKGRPRRMVKAFRREVVPLMLEHVAQVGVKECSLKNWRLYGRYLRPCRTIVLVRDPRDIYLSTREYADRVPAFRERWEAKGYDGLLADMRETWREQKRILATGDCFPLRYEDLCSGKTPFGHLARYCELSFDEPAECDGATSKLFSFRSWEGERHGSVLSGKTVYRWQSEADPERLAAAQRFARDLGDYCRVLEYEPPAG
jgi:hypothetical protein